MKVYAESQIQKEDQQLFLRIKQALDAVDEFDTIEKPVSCHVIAYAVAKKFAKDNLKVETGYYKVGFEHSWLRTKNNNIIDVYPVGTIGGPLLIDNLIFDRYDGLYTINNRVKNRINTKGSFYQDVEKVYGAI